MWQMFIEPNDVLLFRDGKPFMAGEDHRARSLFPPTPFTMQGVVRSKVLFDRGVSPHDYAHAATPGAQALMQEIGGVGSSYGQLRLRGPFVAKRNASGIMRYVPLPADMVRVGDDYRLVKPLADHPFGSNQPTDLLPLWTRTDQLLKEARGWLAEQVFIERYVQGLSLRKNDVICENQLLVREPRFGIALDYTPRRPQEGMLYQMEFLRLREGVGLLLEVDGIDPFTPRGFLQVGGEARPAAYEVLQIPLPPLAPINPLPRQFKVILLTPAWFNGGWQPQGGDWRQFFDGKATLISVALPRAQSIGGAFVDDRRRSENFQKPMRRFVSAGSVFFFESDGAVAYNGKPFTETPPGEGDFGQIGFGCMVTAPWDYA
jgi:CRISPR-associated protein Cmr3